MTQFASAIEAKDAITILVSSLSLLVSGVAFWISFRQRAREDLQTTRGALSETLNSLATVVLDFAKLAVEHPIPTPAVVGLRRACNSQRRALVNHAEFLARTIPDLTTEIDHNLLAQSQEVIGNYELADAHWKESVRKSISPAVKGQNLRGYARFCFFQGRFAEGRKLYEQSLLETNGDTDGMRRQRSDTHILWSVTEREFGFSEEAKRQLERSMAEADRIGNILNRQEMRRYIDSLWAENRVPNSALSPSADFDTATMGQRT